MFFKHLFVLGILLGIGDMAMNKEYKDPAFIECMMVKNYNRYAM